MSHILLGQFFKTEAQVIARYKELRLQTHREYCVIVGKKGYLLVGENALKDAGLLPRKKNGKKLSPSGILKRGGGSL